MSVVILSSLIDGTGNRTTAQRLCSYLEYEQFTVHLCDINTFQTPQLFNTFVIEHHVQAIIGIHMVKAGRLLLGVRVPFVIIAGGTDMNVSTKDADAVNLMTEVVKHAHYFLVFTECARKMAANIWPSLNKKVIVQPQGVCAAPTHFTFADLFRQYKQVNINVETMEIFLIVGGIRPVKDPLYITDVISGMHSANPCVCLVIIGPELDVEYTAQCHEKITTLRGVYIFSEIACSKVHCLMTQCVALVNSSESEGMCGAILEAMYLGTPVIARRNDGNLSIVRDNENGLVYASREEFCSKALLLLSNPALRTKLIENGKTYVQQHHCAGKEKETYVTLMRELISAGEE